MDTLYRQFRGLTNRQSEEEMGRGDLVIGDNIDITKTKRLKRRDGYASVAAMSGAHSLFAKKERCLFVKDGVLYRLLSDYSTQALESGLSDDPMSYYANDNGVIYMSNGVDALALGQNGPRSWGLVPPVVAGKASAVGGALRAGTYLFNVVFVRDDGQVSGGAISREAITLSEKGGIAFTDLAVSSDPTVIAKKLYMSPGDGETLYLVAVLSNSTTTYTMDGDGVNLSIPIRDEILTAAPAGHLVSSYRSRMLVASDQYLFFSQPFGPELFDRRDYIDLGSSARVIAPTEDGVYVSTDDRTVWLPGDDMADLGYFERDNTAGISGTLAYVPPDLLGFDNTAGLPNDVPIWTTEGGIVIGLPGGTLINVTGSRYQFSGALDSGAAYYDRQTSRYVSIIND